MRSNTPRATPLVASPPPTSRRAPSITVVAPKLVGGVLVVWGGVHHEHKEGTLLIGRSQECDVVLDHPLVSRAHARVSVEATFVSIEDLHSMNGVYLRGERIARIAYLHEGDRVLVGTHEVSFFRLPTPGSGLVDDAESLRAPPVDLSSSVPANRHNLAMVTLVPPAQDVPATVRTAGLELVGTLARRFAAEGRPEDGASLLEPHLKRILLGAISGLDVSAQLCTHATALAVCVASWARAPLWLDYIVQLHLAAKQLMSRSAIDELLAAELVVGSLDELLLRYYVESFAARRASFDEEEKARLRLLERSLLRRR